MSLRFQEMAEYHIDYFPLLSFRKANLDTFLRALWLPLQLRMVGQWRRLRCNGRGISSNSLTFKLRLCLQLISKKTNFWCISHETETEIKGCFISLLWLADSFVSCQSECFCLRCLFHTEWFKTNGKLNSKFYVLYILIVVSVIEMETESKLEYQRIEAPSGPVGGQVALGGTRTEQRAKVPTNKRNKD